MQSFPACLPAPHCFGKTRGSLAAKSCWSPQNDNRRGLTGHRLSLPVPSGPTEMATVIDSRRTHRVTHARLNQEEKGLTTYFPKALCTWSGSAVAPALQGNPDGLSGPSSQRGFRAGDQDLVWPLLPPSQPSHPQLWWGIGPRRPIQSHGHCPAPFPWGHLDWGCCQNPFHHLLLTVGTTAFQGCEPWPNSTSHWGTVWRLMRRLLLLPSLYPLASSSHKRGIPTTFASPKPPNTIHTAAETLERLTETRPWSTWPPCRGNSIPQGLLSTCCPSPQPALPGTLVTFISNIGTVHRVPFLLSTAWKSAKPNQSTCLQQDNYVVLCEVFRYFSTEVILNPHTKT